MELIQDKRVLQHTKKKTISKKGQNGLPELKFSPAVVRKMNENFMMSDSSRAPSYQPLSNILISKKIYPTNPELEGRHHLLANQADPNLSIKRLLESHQLVI